MKIQDENNTSDIPNHDHQTKLQHQSRGRTQRTRKENRDDFQIHHIPTLLNGKIENKSMETVSSVVTYMNSVTKNKLRQHKITMIGDSFLRGIRENVELSLSDKFGIHSMVKPGCELIPFLNQQIVFLGSLTQRDTILICGGSNDFNIDKGESIIVHIMEFIKTINHTNIVLANVPF